MRLVTVLDIVMLITTVTWETGLIENLLRNVNSLLQPCTGGFEYGGKLQLTPKKYAKIVAFRVLIVFSAKKPTYFGLKIKLSLYEELWRNNWSLSNVN